MALRTLVNRNALRTAPLCFRGLHTFSLPDLPYDYGALEPVISGEIMQLHHQKHHQTYITNYNKALEQLDGAIAKGDASTVVKLQSAIKFNGGGSTFCLKWITGAFRFFNSVLRFLLSIHWDLFLIMGVLGLLHTHSYIIATKPLYVGKNWESGTGNSKWIFCWSCLRLRCQLEPWEYLSQGKKNSCSGGLEIYLFKTFMNLWRQCCDSYFITLFWFLTSILWQSDGFGHGPVVSLHIQFNSWRD